MNERSEVPERGDRTRARDVDRVSVMATLDDAVADGQLDYVEYRERVDRAQRASVLGELALLTADLQPTETLPGTRRPTPPNRRTRIVLAVAGALAVATAVTVTVVVIPSGHTTISREVESRDPLINGPMFTAAGIREVVAATQKRFHTTVVEGIHIYRDSATLHVVDPTSPTGSTHYDYSPGGEFHNPQVYSGLAVSSTGGADVVVDLQKIDATRVADLITSAPRQLGINATLTGRSPFRVTIGGDDGGEIWMGVNDMNLDSHLVAHLDGKIKGVHRCGWGC